MDVIVVNVVSSKDFCVQQLSDKHSKALEKLTEAMGQYYHDNPQRSSKLYIILMIFEYSKDIAMYMLNVCRAFIFSLHDYKAC